jgi:hypothetical protein
VRGDAAAAVTAKLSAAQSRTGDIDFTDHASPEPPFANRPTFAPRGRGTHANHLTDELVAGRAAEIMVTAEKLEIGIANAG